MRNEFDVIVIGEGLSGVTAAATARKLGAHVMLASKGPGNFVRSRLCGSLRKAPRYTTAAGCAYEGGVQECRLVPTIMGTFAEASLAPRSLWKGDPRGIGSAVVVGIENVFAFDANFLAERLSVRSRELGLAYHAPCHLKSQGIGRPWLLLLRAIPNIEIEEMKADCCGMAGTYGFKHEKHEISVDIGRELFERIAAYKPDAVASECGSCQMQIEHGTGLKAIHPAEILYAAYQPVQE